MNEWFERWPSDHMEELRARFLSENDDDFFSAAQELILHELLVCLGGELTIHPEIPGARGRHPDFLMNEAQGTRIVEATLAWDASQGLARRRDGWLTSTINLIGWSLRTSS